MNESGTNSVKPPVRSCSSRTTRMCSASSARLLDVAEHDRHRRAQAARGAAASMISTQRATGSLFGLIRSRTPSCEHLGGGAGRRAQPGLAQPREHLVAAASPQTSHMCATSIGRTRAGGCSGAGLLGQPQPAAGSPRAPSRGGCPTACRSRSRRTRPPRARGARTPSRVVLVGVGRALALAEAAERAADDADVGDVDVAVDDERDRVAGQLGAQLVGGLAHVLDRLGARLGEQRRQLLGVERARRRGRARSCRAAGPLGRRSRRPEPRRGMKLQ